MNPHLLLAIIALVLIIVGFVTCAAVLAGSADQLTQELEDQISDGDEACMSGWEIEDSSSDSHPVEIVKPRETIETISAWGLATFGPVEFARIAERANEEMKELLANPTSVEEAADIVIILTRWPNLWQAIERKMAINRARKWRLMGDGTGYHIPAAENATPIIPSHNDPDQHRGQVRNV